MESSDVQAFNKCLYSMYDCKPPISKQKIFDITKCAMNAVHHFKHVVVIVEKFLVKCRNEYKISGLYVIDSILRQARKQYKHKDVFAPRFAINLKNTFINILSCDIENKLKAVRVINLWLANKIFDEDVIAPLLQHCRATGLEVNTEKVELIVKGDKANMQIYGAEANLNASLTKTGLKKLPKTPPKPRTPPLELRPQTPPELSFEFQHNKTLNDSDILMLLESYETRLAKIALENKIVMNKLIKVVNDKILEKLEIEKRRQGNIKVNLLAREFDYSDEDDEDDVHTRTELNMFNPSYENILVAAKSLFLDGSLINDFNLIYHEATTQNHRPKTPPILFQSTYNNNCDNNEISQPFLFQKQNFMPQSQMNSTVSTFTPYLSSTDGLNQSRIEASSSFELQNDSCKEMARRDKNLRKRERNNDYDDDMRHHNIEDPRRRDRHSNNKDRSDRRSNLHSEKKQRRSRSPSQRDKDRDHRDYNNSTKIRDKEHHDLNNEEFTHEKEKERKKNGFPMRLKESHVLIASRTIWFGRIPINCSESDICEAIKSVGVPEKINIVAPRACAYVTMKERRAAFKIKSRFNDLQVARKKVKLSWATIQGLKNNERLMDYWDMDRGIALIPYNKLPDDLSTLLDDAYLDVDTLPAHLKNLYDSKGLKKITTEYLNQTLIPLPSVSENSASQSSTDLLTAAAAAPPMIFPPGMPPFNFQHQMPMPMPFPNNQTINNNTKINIPKVSNSFTFTTGQQQAVAANAAAIAGMTTFNNFTPPSFLPFNTPNNAAAAAATSFLNSAPPPRFSNQNNSTSQSNNNSITSNNKTSNRNQYNNFKSGRGSFNNNRGASGAHRFQRGGRGNYANRGSFNSNRGDFNHRGGFSANQSGGSTNNWSSTTLNNRFQNNDEGYDRTDKGNKFGAFPRSAGRNNFNFEFDNITSNDEFNVKSEQNNQNTFLKKQQNDKRISNFSDNSISTSVDESITMTTPNSSGNNNTNNCGILPAIASTATDAIPLLDASNQLNKDASLSDWSKIALPQLSAATISNLREIISATSTIDNKNVLNDKTTISDESDEYDDNDDDYFRVFDLRRKQMEADAAAQKKSQQIVEDNQIDEEVTSTTFYDESDSSNNINEKFVSIENNCNDHQLIPPSSTSELIADSNEN